jgi:hypothetical protein
VVYHPATLTHPGFSLSCTGKLTNVWGLGGFAYVERLGISSPQSRWDEMDALMFVAREEGGQDGTTHVPTKKFHFEVMPDDEGFICDVSTIWFSIPISYISAEASLRSRVPV